MLNTSIHEKFLSQLTQYSLQNTELSLQSNQALHASALVGRKVLLECTRLHVTAKGEVRVAVDVPEGLSQLHVIFSTESDKLIKTIVLDCSVPGLLFFNWDGRAEDNHRVKEGNYTIAVHAVSAQGEKVLLKAMSYANVDSVSLGQDGEGLRLNASGIGSISLDEVFLVLFLLCCSGTPTLSLEDLY
jgi:flagellar basal-body rod modification protein FlgD